MPIKLRLDLYRHGQTELNQQRRYQGRLDFPLCQEGRQALKMKAAAARARGPLKAVFASPMLRCRETASLLFPDFQPILLPELRERDFGPYEGKSWEELKDDPVYRRFIDTEGEEGPEDMETNSAFSSRLLRGFGIAVNTALLGVSNDATAAAALVFHGGGIMQLTRLLLFRDGSESSLYQFQLGPGECLSLSMEKDEEALVLTGISHD